MEDRLTPANLDLVVNITTDVTNLNDNYLTLREALEQCNAETPTTTHTISFANNIKGLTITLDPNPTDYGRLSIKKNVEIEGSELMMHIKRDQTSATKHQLFYVASGVTAKLNHLDLSRGEIANADGGAIISFGNLTMDFCRIHDNAAPDGVGGGIYAQAGSLTLIECDFDDNSASKGGGLGLNGVVCATLTDSTFYHNLATTGGGMFIFCPADGDPPAIVLDHCSFERNESLTDGGGLYVEPATAGPGVLLTLKNGTEFVRNKAFGTNGKGGGVYFGRGTITFAAGPMQPVRFDTNTAPNGDGLYRVTGTTMVGATGGLNPDLIFVDDQQATGGA
jgi:hypothetical protein